MNGLVSRSLVATCLVTISGVAWGESADIVYQNGPILTIDDSAPAAEAVAVKDGIVIAVGTEEEVFKLQDDATKLIDLEGRTMLPGFVDAHGHVMGGGLQALSANLLAPPDGEVKDIAALQQTLKDWMEANKEAVDKIQLVVGFGYDNSQLAELRHPNREDLDAVFTNLLLEMSGANLPSASAGGAFTSPPCASCACGALSQLMDAAAIGE